MHPYSTVPSIAQRLVQVHAIVEKIAGVNGPLLNDYQCYRSYLTTRQNDKKGIVVVKYE